VHKPNPLEREKELSSIDLIVSKADESGNITYVNPIFIKISGYTQGELYDKPHSILRHPDMPKVIFKYLWDNLHADNEVTAYVKNLCKDGSYYWVLATVKSAKNPDGSFRNYMSTRRCVSEHAKSVMSQFYAKLLAAETQSGIEASQELLNLFMQENGISDADSFNNFMKNLNK
jgi:PAS domain S-box-containing protein